MNARELMAQRAAKIAEAKTIASAPAMTDEQRTKFDGLMKDAETMKGDIARLSVVETEDAALDQSNGTRAANTHAPTVPNLNLKTKPGDTEERALVHYLRTGDLSREIRASNDTDMNIGTSADGGAAVPTGLYNRIVAKRNEKMLAAKLNLMKIPGKGTTVNVAADNGTANVFVETNEATSSDRDAPAITPKAMALKRYTKKLQLSDELLDDEDAAILAFVEDYVSRGWANTHNSLLVAEALASGTTFALGAAAAATDTDISGLVYALADGYQDNPTWIMRRATEGAYRALKGSVFQFAPTPGGNAREMWTYPVLNSAYVPAIGTTNKSVIFGNFDFMMVREAKGLTVLRDPYSSAATGQINYHYAFRAVYKLGLAEAIRYGTHP